MTTWLKYYGPAYLWAFFIFVMCTIKMSSEEGSHFFFAGFDKLVHCGFFFGMVVFISIGFIRQQSPALVSYKQIIAITAIAIVYGGIIELLQNYVFTWRDGDWNDLFADSVGAGMAGFSILLTLNAVKYVKK